MRATLSAVSERLATLHDVMRLCRSDPDLMRLVDSSIQQRMKGAEEKQAQAARAAQ